MTISLKKKLIGLILISFAQIPTETYSQTGNISGIITDSKSGEPILFASVFLSNSSNGAQSDNKGRYSLKNIRPGQYEFIVKYVGYEAFQQVLTMDEKDLQLNIKLVPKIHELNEVVVKPDPNRARNLAIFKREFIGNSEGALKFKFINPEAVTISYDQGKLLEASSDDFLIFENRHLGYRIKYLLKEFTRTFIPGTLGEGIIYYEGATLFEELKGNQAQLKRWKKNRLNTYLGSCTHFYRSLLQNTIKQEGFAMYQLIKKENPDRPADNIIENKLRQFNLRTISSDIMKKDSLDYWIDKKSLPKQMHFLLKDTLKTKNIFFKTDHKELFAITFPNYLYITYKGSRLVKDYSNVYKPIDIGDVAVSIVNLKEKYAFFDQNGIIANPRSVIYEGSWTTKIPAMLPHDYDPGD